MVRIEDQDWIEDQNQERPGPASVDARFDTKQTAIVVPEGVGDHSADSLKQTVINCES